LRGTAQSKMCISGGTTRARVMTGGPSWRRFVYLEIIPSGRIQILDGIVSVSRFLRDVLLSISASSSAKHRLTTFDNPSSLCHSIINFVRLRAVSKIILDVPLRTMNSFRHLC
jgi:hypothetical protein